MLSERTSSSRVVVKPGVDIFGCPLGKLGKNQELSSNGLTFYRKSSDDPHLGQIATDGDDRGFVIGASLAGGHRRRVFHESHATTHDFEANSVYVRNLADPYRADLKGSFDFLLMELSRPFVCGIADEHGRSGHANLAPDFGRSDPVLSNLLRALQPALARTYSHSPIFVEQLGLAISIHLLERYDGIPVVQPQKRALLSRSQMAIASDLLRNNPDSKISIAELAAACGLSRGYFIHAFKTTTGLTPHQWILSQRVEQARDLLKNSDLTLADVALICGFADQSHFTRVFSRMAGASPGHWRRSVRN